MEIRDRKIELLSPARDFETGKEAILHGADAVYIGPRSFGARAAAGNSTEDLARLADFAHTYRARVYATVNTIFYDSEAREVERLIRDLYKAGVDAIIVQDMGILRLDIPPIELHASTQCDIRNAKKAKFLEDVGFSQIVLARELTIKEIKDITKSVTIPVETFIHGALCVSYSGRCHASEAMRRRSANRGACSQLCRLPYTLTDSEGKILERDKYLLSLRDFNASASIGDLIKAGVSSFKIEGRLKDIPYVKNITSHYNNLINHELKALGGQLGRSSAGRVELSFTPAPAKSFNRGFTNYFLTSRRPASISSPLTPKSQGEEVKEFKMLHKGDGISFLNKEGIYSGGYVNGISGSRLLLSGGVKIPKGANLRRTYDIEFDKVLKKNSASRKIRLDIQVESRSLIAEDERGVRVTLPMPQGEAAKKEFDFISLFNKFGNTPYFINTIRTSGIEKTFYPASVISKIRRQLVELLDDTNQAVYPYKYRREESKAARYMIRELDFRENVANEYAREFYENHGSKVQEWAIEKKGHGVSKGAVVMTCRHCILRERGACLKKVAKSDVKLPLILSSGDIKFQLEFDCGRCEMLVLRK